MSDDGTSGRRRSRGYGRLGLFTSCITVLFALWLGAAPAFAGHDAAEVKAVVLLRALSFIEWPPVASGAEPDLVIAVLGDSALEAPLRRHAATVTVRSRHCRIVHAVTLDDTRRASVVIVGTNWYAHLDDVVRASHAERWVVVGDATGLGRRGVALNLVEEDRRVRIEVNRRSFARIRVQASYHLFAIARLVEGP